MTAADLPRVLEIEQVAFKNPWSADLLRRELGHDWSTILVAEEPGPRGQTILLGFVIFWVVHDELHILNVATAPEHRCRGVARRVLQAALDQGRRRRCTLATLEVRRSNGAALGLYRDFGFRPVGIRPNYYVDEGEDAIVMVLDL
ncbi:MAG TPA: ribosomal protein S18-alanine N-acetyltransferase [Myxococcaceae bacterium]|jgi:ribosomal-protein-alanine N-acetyltransferase|nr:ribosomal protein S18-alanine N-acetyltransferase [Myxococcaceae bacterium]